MPRRFRRLTTALAVAGLAALALGGQLVVNQSVATVGRNAGLHWTVFTAGYDFWPIWRDDHFFTSGQGDAHWYGAGISNAWPPPHEVLLAPFSFLSYDGAHLASALLTAALMVLVVLGWSREPEQRHRAGQSGVAWPILMSAPVFAVVWIDQLQAALGLAALSLAIWAQRRQLWWLVGIAAAVGLIRPLNAIPVLCILLLGGWGKPRQLGIAAGAGAVFMAPLLLISYLWDRNFVSDYIAGITAYPFNGTPKAVVHSIGPWGLGVLMVIGCAAALWLVRKDVGKPLDAGRAGLVLSLTVPLAPLGGLYPAIFALPALIRLGQRQRFRAVPLIASVGPWLVILLLSPWLLGSNPGLVLNFLSFIGYALVLLAYPLLRIPPGDDVARDERDPADDQVSVA